MKPYKITFLFNQLLSDSIYTGGEIRGKIIATKFKQDKNFNVEVMIPEVSKPSFKEFKKIILGHQSFEKNINHNNLISAFILYITRTFEFLTKISTIKTDIIYATGDFICNIIPSFFLKIKYPKTKFIVCVHHINENPFKRKSNYFIASLVSYIFQQTSFFLIKKKADLIFVINNQVKDYFLKRNFKTKIVVVGNGLETQDIKNKINSLTKIKASNQISYFGRLSPTKGTMDFPIILSNILKKIPNTHLDLVGIALPEIKKPLIEKFHKYHCDDHYTIHGFIKDQTDVFKIILQSKVIIFPSYEEGWAISLFESIMTKRPVITYRLPVFIEIFKNKLITVPIGNTELMSQKAVNLIKDYFKPSTKKYIKDCYQIAQKYDWENVFNHERKSIINLVNQ